MPPPAKVLCAALLLGISALTLLGCGGGDTTTATATTGASPARKSPKAGGEAARATRCGLGTFLRDLDTLESRLAAGLSYEQYFAEVQGARSAYEKIPVGSLDLPCLDVGTPAEKALDEYIESANVWRECRADVSCGTYTIEPRLQRKWRVASRYLALAHAGHA